MKDLVWQEHVSIVVEDSDSDIEVCKQEMGAKLSPDFNHLDPALFGIAGEETDALPEIPVLPAASNQAQPINLKEWPGKDSLASELLQWAKAMGTPVARLARIPQWVKYFGAKYELQPPTVYHYAAFVDEVDYHRMKQWVEAWPEDGPTNKHNLTISQVWRHFQFEFNVVSGLVKKQTGTSSPQRSRKRKSHP